MYTGQCTDVCKSKTNMVENVSSLVFTLYWCLLDGYTDDLMSQNKSTINPWDIILSKLNTLCIIKKNIDT